MKAFQGTIRFSFKSHATSKLQSLTAASLYRPFSVSRTMSFDELPDITASPAADQHIAHEGKEYTTIREGLAYILIPASASKTPQTTPKGENQPQDVFYNPIQQFNRDLSVLAIKAYGEEAEYRRRRVFERKKERNAKKTAEKKQQKKRKREEDELNPDASRKAGKVDGSNNGGIEELVGNEENKAHADGIEAGNETLLQEAGRPRTGEMVIEKPNGTTALAPTSTDTPMPGSTALPTESTSQPTADVKEANGTTTVGTSSDSASLALAGASTAGAEQAKASGKPPFELKFTILDALSATGLRALRYAQEIPFTTSITANDLEEAATKTISLNVLHNKQGNKIKAVTGDARAHMYNLASDYCKDDKGEPQPSAKYHVIDLDPYGTAAPFLDAAVQAVRDDGGLLCVTCTDAGVWASNGYPEKSYSLYGGLPMKGNASHEGGLRLILHAIATSAARYGLVMEPLLSLSIDFYARVFVRIWKSPVDVKFLAGKTMMVYNCDTGCGAWTTQTIGRNSVKPSKSGKGHFWKHGFGVGPPTGEHCKHCGAKAHMAGPMYGGPIHNAIFIQRILDMLPNLSKDTYQTTTRIEGMLNLALEELLPPDEDPDSPSSTSKTGKFDPSIIDPAPFFFIPSSLAKVIHCVTPVENAFRGALRHLGYHVTRSHCKPGSIKTNAPWEVVWEVMREWATQKHPIRDGAIRENTAGYRIMGLDKAKKAGDANGEPAGEDVQAETPKLKVVFDEKLGKDLKRDIVRYQLNPRENWGPMNRAKGGA
jgi:tRNA (guanine26-N2/guanine27-N2)-dimethyltransferase